MSQGNAGTGTGTVATHEGVQNVTNNQTKWIAAITAGLMILAQAWNTLYNNSQIRDAIATLKPAVVVAPPPTSGASLTEQQIRQIVIDAMKEANKTAPQQKAVLERVDVLDEKLRVVQMTLDEYRPQMVVVDPTIRVFAGNKGASADWLPLSSLVSVK